jgi:hypothetical protein
VSEFIPTGPLLRSEREQLTLDLARLRAALDRGRAAALVCFIALLALGFSAIAFSDRKYDIDAIVVSADVPGEGLENLGSFASLAASVGLANIGSDTLNESLALLTSRSFIGEFISQERLMPKLFPDAWDEEAGKWKSRWFRSTPTDADAYEYFMEEVLTVRKDPTTGLVTVRITWKDPVEAAGWANTLIDRLNLEFRRRAIKDADDMMSFLERELNKTQLLAVKESIFRLAEAQLNAKAVANVREEFSLRFVDRAIPKDRKNYDHPKVVLFGLITVFAALGSALIAGVAWGSTRGARSGGSVDG